MWGPSPGAADPFFLEKNWRPFLVITIRVSSVSSREKLATFFIYLLFFGHHCRFYSFHGFTRVSRIISGMQKNVALLFVGPLFCRTC